MHWFLSNINKKSTFCMHYYSCTNPRGSIEDMMPVTAKQPDTWRLRTSTHFRGIPVMEPETSSTASQQYLMCCTSPLPSGAWQCALLSTRMWVSRSALAASNLRAHQCSGWWVITEYGSATQYRFLHYSYRCRFAHCTTRVQIRTGAMIWCA